MTESMVQFQVLRRAELIAHPETVATPLADNWWVPASAVRYMLTDDAGRFISEGLASLTTNRLRAAVRTEAQWDAAKARDSRLMRFRMVLA